MELAYKEDWPQAKNRWAAFWEGEVVDRVALAVTAPREKQVLLLPEVPYQTRHTDLEYLLRSTNIHLQNTFFGGEAVPGMTVMLVYIAFGCPNPGWIEPSPWANPWIPHSSLDFYRFDPQNPWFTLADQLIQAMAQDGQGMYFVAPATSGPTDSLQDLRGLQGVCMDMVDYPDEVQALLEHLTDTTLWMWERWIPRVKMDGGTCAAPVFWHPDQTWQVQCDFSIAISAQMFKKFVIPELERLCRYLGRTCYHIDGRRALRHLPALDWNEAIDVIRAHLRGVHLFVECNRIEEAIQRLGPKGIFIHTQVPTEEAARKLLKDAERWSCQRPWDIR